MSEVVFYMDNTEKELAYLKKNMEHLCLKAEKSGIPMFTDFLDLRQQETACFIKKGIDVRLVMYGGFEGAERKMAGWIPVFSEEKFENKFEDLFPIFTIKIVPAQKKFCEDLNHRDYLGAVINLGLDRSQLGDILIKETDEGKTAYIFAARTACDLIIMELNRVRHTNVKCSIMDERPQGISPNLEEKKISISSERLDVVLSSVYGISRGHILPYITGEKVSRNQTVVKSPDSILKENDIISVRGLGKFRYGGVSHENKKGRLSAAVWIYK